MVPGLRTQRRQSRQFPVSLGSGLDQCQLAAFGLNQEQRLLGQQQKLAVAVTPPSAGPFPGPLSVGCVDTGEELAVLTVDVFAMQDTIIKERFQITRGPPFGDLPVVFLRSPGDLPPPSAFAVTGAEHDVVGRDQ